MKNQKPTYKELEKEIALLRKEKEEIFWEAFNHSPNMYASVSLDDGSILFCNNKFLNETGYSREEVIGSPIFRMYHNDCLIEAKTTFQQFLDQGEIRNKELVLKKKNGDKIFVLLNINEVRNKEGEIVSSILSWKDISIRKKTEFELLKAKESAEQSDAKFKVYTAQSPIAIYTTNVDGDCVYTNETWLEMAGMDREEPLGKGWINALHPDDIDCVYDNWYKSVKSKGKWAYEYRFIDKNKKITWVEGTSKELFNEKNELIGYLGTNVNITQRKKAKEALKEREEILSEMFRNMRDGVCLYKVIDEGNDFIYADINDAGEKIAKIKKSTIIGKSIFEVRPKTDKYDLIDVFKKVWKTGKSETFNESFFQNGELTGYFKNFVYKLSSGEIVAIFEDQTKKKLIDQKLIESEQNQRELNATKDKLISIISHDLRSPFTSIIGLTNLLPLIYNDTHQDIEKAESIAEMINLSAQNTLVLLDNLLDWTRSQTGKIEFRPSLFNLEPIIIETFRLLDSAAEVKNISLNYSPSISVEVYADKNMLTTVLRNLISNAIKFTHKKGEIDVSAIQKESVLEITVQDNGIGIHKDIQKKLFQIEKSLTTKGTENEKGSGLGLLICKEFINKHGGEIWVDSEIAKGTAFKFTLPLNRSE